MSATYSVPEITCGHCENAINAEVAVLPGVEGVQVDLEAKTVTVETAGALDDGAVREAIARAGYEVAG